MYMIEAPLSPAIATAVRSVPRLRAPIVLVHGLLGFDRIAIGPWLLSEYFCGIPAHLAAHGNRVLAPSLSLTAGVASRAQQLLHFLKRHSPAEPVHLIAHSMGGLDARYLISRLHASKRVLSLTTIGTPHRGSSYADWWLRRVAAVCRPMFDLLRLPYQAFLDLTVTACREFNIATPDDGGVRYFSVAGRCVGPWLTWPWLHPHGIVEKAEGENDGVVSVASASWGESTDVWDGDHFNLINAVNLSARRHGLWIDRTLLYANLVRRLADEGF